MEVGMGRVVAATCVTASVFFAHALPAGAVAGFGDVAADEFYSSAIQWMVDGEITSGTAPGCFEPGQATSRAEIAAFIHRFHGEPPGGYEPFADVNTGDWFRAPVAWMVGEGITTGTSPTTFDPYRYVTRGELAAFLYRAEGSPTVALSGDFSDVAPGAFYAAPVSWMVGEGITTGTTPTTFEPSRYVTRGEVATFLYRVAGEPPVSLTPGGSCQEAGEANELAAAEAMSFALLNELRASVGVGPVVRTQAMDEFAGDWSETMDLSGEFQHSGGPYAENIAWWSASGATPEEAADVLHDLWVNSSGHYANMTRYQWTTVGIGFWRSSSGWHATHVFSY